MPTYLFIYPTCRYRIQGRAFAMGIANIIEWAQGLFLFSKTALSGLRYNLAGLSSAPC